MKDKMTKGEILEEYVTNLLTYELKSIHNKKNIILRSIIESCFQNLWELGI